MLPAKRWRVHSFNQPLLIKLLHARSYSRGWGPCRKQTHTSPAFVEFIPQAEGVRPQIHKNSISVRLCHPALNGWFRVTDFSFHWLLSLWSTGSRVQAQELRPMDFVALRHVGSSPPRDQICVPCADRQFLTTGPPGKSESLDLNSVSQTPRECSPNILPEEVCSLK